MKKICIITDTYPEQINGVVTTLRNVKSELIKKGYDVKLITASDFKSISYPLYKEIRLSLNLWKLPSLIRDFDPDSIHIATEGPLGIAGRFFCLKNKIPFTTSYHTKFPEYIHERFPLIPTSLIYKILKKFHSPSKAVLVTNNSLKHELEYYGFTNLVVWSRGVELDKFKPEAKDDQYTRPVLIYVGRVSIEKNIDDFLNLTVPGTKVVVGDGPELKRLRKQHKDVIWLGRKTGKELVNAYNMGDIFVFPSKSDTFGIVMIEANACGLPIAAYPVTGPSDYVVNGVNGFLDDNLEVAVQKCINNVQLFKCREHAEKNSWEKCADIFLDNLVWKN